MTITKISKQVKRTDRYSVEVDDNFSFSISANDLIKQSIAKGDVIDEKRLRELKILSAKSLLLDNCLWYLSSRPHSVKEVRDYLRRKIYRKPELKKLPKDDQETVTNNVISYLLDRKYLDDKDFTNWFVKQRINSRNPKSKRFIQNELYQKGVDQEVIQNALKEITDEQELQNVIKLAKKKLNQPSTKRHSNNDKESKMKDKQRLIQYLQTRGYSYRHIKGVVDSVLPDKLK